MINFLIVALVAGYSGFVIYKMHKKKKEGGGCLGCSCSSGCCSGCSCEEKKEP